MAATRQAPGGAILLAALALPGLAGAENVPEQASISLKYLDYQDRQPNLERVGVHSPSLELVLPVAGRWALRGALVSDVISGASPRYHTAVSGASRFSEKRHAADLSVTRYFARASATLAGGRSKETDYDSRFVSARATVSSADNNTTWLFGAGVANDRIDPVNRAVNNEHKRTLDLMLGVTRVLGARDIGQLVLGHVRGRGYFSNPYKFVDARLRTHDQNSALLRWNHHFSASGATSRLSYRYTTDSYALRSHTAQQEYVRPLKGGWTLTPSLRLYTQSAARFYFDPVYDTRFGAPFPPGFSFAVRRDLSADQRLAAYGALTAGLKVEKQLGPDTTLDFKWEQYRQRAGWRLFGSGSPGLERFSARSIQAGVSHRW
ncbi:MAG: DUF3570 domain-containing protein [Telluria sp.]